MATYMAIYTMMAICHSICELLDDMAYGHHGVYGPFYGHDTWGGAYQRTSLVCYTWWHIWLAEKTDFLSGGSGRRQPSQEYNQKTMVPGG